MQVLPFEKGIRPLEPTCTNKHDIILPILCLHSVNHNLFQLVRNVGLHQHRLAKCREHRAPHQRVAAGELQHRVREVLRAAKLFAGLVGDFAWALARQEEG